MKKLRVVCNHIHTPLKYPAMVKYYYAGAGMGEIGWKRAIQERADKEQLVIFRIELVGTDCKNLPGAEGEVL